MNVTNRVRLPIDDLAVGIDCPRRERFDKCTDRLFYGMITSLHNARAVGNLENLLKMEIDYGLKYDRHSMFIDNQLKPMLSTMKN